MIYVYIYIYIYQPLNTFCSYISFCSWISFMLDPRRRVLQRRGLKGIAYRSTGVNPNILIPLFSTILAESYNAIRAFISSFSEPIILK